MNESNPYSAPTTAPATGIGTAGQPKYAGFGVRLGALIIDSILLMAVQQPLLMAMYGTDYMFDPNQLRPGQILISWVFPIVYVVGFWSARGATPGKMLVGVRIVRSDGSRPHLGQLIGRYFAYMLSAIPLGLGYFWVISDPRKQGWHDKLANTVVVYPAVARGDE